MTEPKPNFDEETVMEEDYRIRMVKAAKTAISKAKLNMTTAESVEIFAYLLVDSLARASEAEELLANAVMRATMAHKAYRENVKQRFAEKLKQTRGTS